MQVYTDLIFSNDLRMFTEIKFITKFCTKLMRIMKIMRIIFIYFMMSITLYTNYL